MLLEKLKAGEVSAEGLRIVLEAGIREPMIMRANQALYAQLHPIKESIFCVRLTADMMRFVGAVA